MSRHGDVIKIGPNRYRIVHRDYGTGQVAQGRPCAYCGRPRTIRSRGLLCSQCRRVAARRRAVGEE